MRAIVVGAVESTRVALAALARGGWDVAAVVTLPLALAGRHSDFVDLAPDAAAVGADLIAAPDANAPEVVARLAALRPDIAFVIGWSQLCRPAMVAALGGRLVGYHPAPLPRLRGRGVIPWTILLDEPITASSLFWIDEGVDSGPIIGQQYLHLARDETATTLYARHMAALATLLDRVLPELATGTAPALVQDERFATWAARRVPADGIIDWSAPACAVARLVRAVTRPYPGASTVSPRDALTVWHAEPWADGARHAGCPGQVIARDDRGFAVRCGDGGGVWINDFDGAAPRLHDRLGVSA